MKSARQGVNMARFRVRPLHPGGELHFTRTVINRQLTVNAHELSGKGRWHGVASYHSGEPFTLHREQNTASSAAYARLGAKDSNLYQLIQSFAQVCLWGLRRETAGT